MPLLIGRYGKSGLSNQAQTLEHTLDAYTTGGAYVEFAESAKRAT